MLLHLSLIEPGENWIGETYSSSPDLPPMPGWEVSVVWFTEEGLPTFGTLTSFAPNRDLRYALLSAVLIRTDDYRSCHDELHWPVQRQATLKELNDTLKTMPEKVTWTYDSPSSGAHTHHSNRVAHVDKKKSKR